MILYLIILPASPPSHQANRILRIARGEQKMGLLPGSARQLWPVARAAFTVPGGPAGAQLVPAGDQCANRSRSQLRPVSDRAFGLVEVAGEAPPPQNVAFDTPDRQRQNTSHRFEYP
jgi:hypothetical protein